MLSKISNEFFSKLASATTAGAVKAAGSEMLNLLLDVDSGSVLGEREDECQNTVLDSCSNCFVL